MATFDFEEGLRLKAEGMKLAADKRKETLAAVRQYLIDLATSRGDMCVTADDAFNYIERNALEPLGNAAGSLFKGKQWEFTGEWEPSQRKSNHAHRNRIWRYVGEGMERSLIEGESPTPARVKPLSPEQFNKQVKALKELYNNGDCQTFTDKWFDDQMAALLAASKLYGEQR